MGEPKTESDFDKLIEALTDYEQVDTDGALVIASRQACDEAAGILREFEAQIKWIRIDTAHKAPEQITVGLLANYITILEGVIQGPATDNKPGL